MTNENDLIRRGDVLALPHRLSPSLDADDGYYVSVDAIRALPAVAASQTPDPVVKSDSCQSVRVKPLEWVGGDILVATGPDVRVVGHVTEASTKDRYEAERTERILAEIETQPDPRDAVSDAARDVLAERQRQISAEGWTPDQDDAYQNADLAKAAACYAMPTTGFVAKREMPPAHWPWAKSWWKPTTLRRDLVKSGALILAEIERLDRAALAAAKGGD